MNWTGASCITGFKNRLHKSFTYPANRHPFICNFIISLCILFPGQEEVNRLFQIMLCAIFYHYAYLSLKKTSRGDFFPPPIFSSRLPSSQLFSFRLNWKNLFSCWFQVLIHLSLFVFCFSAIFCAVYFAGFPAGMAVLFMVICILPVMLIILVSSESIKDALNLREHASLYKKLGREYFLLVLFLSFTGCAPAICFDIVQTVFPENLHSFFLVFVINYYILVACHLTGCFMFQYHEKIGYAIDCHNFRDPVLTGPEGLFGQKDRKLIFQRQLDMLLMDGKFDEAIIVLKDAEGAVGNGKFWDDDLSGRYLKLLMLKKHFPQMLEHAKTHLDILVKGGDKEKILDLYLKCIDIDPSFTPHASVLFLLGMWLDEKECGRQAVSAYHKFVNISPNDDPAVPAACFNAARIYKENLGNPLKAKKILQALLGKYPDHAVAEDAMAYLKKF